MSVCRVCLQSKAKKDITELTVQIKESEEKVNYEVIMEFCLGIQVSLKESINTKLCLKCYRKIIEFYKFKKLALKSDSYLKSVQFSTVMVLNDEIKKEEVSMLYQMNQNQQDLEGDNDIYDEPLVYVKEECKLESLSDDEFLSVLRNEVTNNNDKEDFVNKEVLCGGKRNTRNKLAVKTKRRGKTKENGIKEVKKMCEVCGKEVKSIKTHQLCHSDIQKEKFKCDMCGKFFSCKGNMRKHIRHKHLNITQQCPDCGKTVKYLNAHRKLKHNPEPQPYQCMVCERRFMYKMTFVNHMRIHTKNTPFECDVCGKAFKLKSQVAMHIRQVHEKERSFICQFCSKTFFKKYKLQVHLRSHTKEKPFECGECHKRFACTTGLKNHKLVHGDKKYNCKMCDMSFVSTKYLHAHVLSHIKEKKYPCQFCGVRFHRSDHRKRHEFTAHLKHDRYDGAKAS